MKITKKQNEEIDFLSIAFNIKPDENQKIEFVKITALWEWIKWDIRYEKNPLIISKRKLDITVKMWAEDMRDWILYYKELLEDYDNHPYIVKIVNSIRKNLTPKPTYDWVLWLATIWFLNSKFNSN